MTARRSVPDITSESLGDHDWLAGGFSAADIPMVDVLRIVDRSGGLSGHPTCQACVERGTVRPAFERAYADRMAHVDAADAKRAESTR